jgi:hypothetical protein
MADAIPFGQPILVGHHSERRDRNYRGRIHAKFAKSFELQKAADEAERRAATESHAISADDPDASGKLGERIVRLERLQTLMVAANKIYRGKDSDAEKIAKLIVLGLSEKAARGGLLPDFAGRIGVAVYALTNNNANIRRLKERLAAIERAQAEAPRADIAGDGFTIREDAGENRLLILFDAIPAEAVRSRLKSVGFKWSPSRGAWVRQLNNAARQSAGWALELPG